MSVLNVKDSDRLEVVRTYVDTDPVFFSIDNRPIEDLNQRDKDLNRIFTPARGFRVRQTSPASTSVEVEAGVYVSADITINQVALSSVAIPGAGVGNIRIDLIWLNLETGAVVRTAGAEIAAGGGFAAAVRPSLPANDAAVPLAFVYVNETPTPFNETIAINTAGHIQDIRPAIGTSRRVFEDTAGNILTDSAGGSVGTSTKVVRADHRHPLNVDGTVPTALGPSVAAAVGSSNSYSRRDHAHAIATEAVAAAFLTDVSGGSAGSSANFPRADHRHPLNVDGTVPSEASFTAASAGSAATYSRADHVHLLPTLLQKAMVFYGAISATSVVSRTTTGSSSIATGGVTVPANTFRNGLFVLAMVETLAFNDVEMVIEAKMDQTAGGGSAKQFAASPNTSVTSRSASVTVGALANLGSPSMKTGMGANDDADEVSTSVMGLGIWAKAGTTGLSGIGSLDWDPTKATLVDFTNLYSTFTGGTSHCAVGVRSLIIVGF